MQANVDSGATLYNYGYDVAGNLTTKDGVTRTYNAANQMVNDGSNSLSYDANGNLLATGYVWDRANRLVATPNTSYAYDGLGNRVAQTVNSVLTEYLNDLQPALPKLLQEVTNDNTTRYIHSLRGIHSMERQTAVGSAVWGTSTWGNFTWGATSSGVLWEQFLQDGLGSVRAIADAAGVVQQGFDYDPYGDPLQAMTGFAFTGEYRDESELQYHRARYYDPMMGIFPSLDPDEGMTCTPMSLNGYSYVHGNPIMNIDPTGMTCCDEYKYEPVAYRACLGNPANQHLPVVGGRACPRMPETRRVQSWEEDFLNIAAISEYRLSAIGYSNLEIERVAYTTAWIILNRITSPCWRNNNISTIVQAGFSGTAIRNSTVYPPALDAAFTEELRTPNPNNPSDYFIADYPSISQQIGENYTNAILDLLDDPGYATEAPIVETARAGSSRALSEWCIGREGPGIARNAVFYATARNVQGFGNPMTEIHNQLAELERIDDGASCNCQFGWVGNDNNQDGLRMIVACDNTLQVPVVDNTQYQALYTQRRLRGEDLAPQLQINYP